MISRASSEGRLRGRAFSLVEVVIALGLCALTVTCILGLLAPVTNAIGETRDAHDAARLIEAVQSQLQEMPFSTVSGYLANGDLLYASRGGERVGPYLSSVWNDLGPAQPDRDREKFFEIALISNDTLSPQPGALVYTMRLRWPAYGPDGQLVPTNALKHFLLIPGAVAR